MAKTVIDELAVVFSARAVGFAAIRKEAEYTAKYIEQLEKKSGKVGLQDFKTRSSIDYAVSKQQEKTAKAQEKAAKAQLQSAKAEARASVSGGGTGGEGIHRAASWTVVANGLFKLAKNVGKLLWNAASGAMGQGLTLSSVGSLSGMSPERISLLQNALKIGTGSDFSSTQSGIAGVQGWLGKLKSGIGVTQQGWTALAAANQFDFDPRDAKDTIGLLKQLESVFPSIQTHFKDPALISDFLAEGFGLTGGMITALQKGELSSWISQAEKTSTPTKDAEALARAEQRRQELLLELNKTLQRLALVSMPGLEVLIKKLTNALDWYGNKIESTGFKKEIMGMDAHSLRMFLKADDIPDWQRNLAEAELHRKEQAYKSPDTSNLINPPVNMGGLISNPLQTQAGREQMGKEWRLLWNNIKGSSSNFMDWASPFSRRKKYMDEYFQDIDNSIKGKYGDDIFNHQMFTPTNSPQMLPSPTSMNGGANNSVTIDNLTINSQAGNFGGLVNDIRSSARFGTIANDFDSGIKA